MYWELKADAEDKDPAKVTQVIQVQENRMRMNEANQPMNSTK